MSEKARLKVTKESNTGRNLEFQDTKTKELLTTSEVAKRIDKGTYEGYHHYKDQKGRTVIRSNPDKNKKNNLG